MTAAMAPERASVSPVLMQAKQLLSEELDRLDALQVPYYGMLIIKQTIAAQLQLIHMCKQAEDELGGAITHSGASYDAASTAVSTTRLNRALLGALFDAQSCALYKDTRTPHPC